MAYYNKLLEDNIDEGGDELVSCPEVTACDLYVPPSQWRSVLRAQKNQWSVWGVKQVVKLRKDDDLQECERKSSHSRKVHFDINVQIHIIFD